MAAANGALVVDGVAPSIGDRVLVKNEGVSTRNGSYEAVDLGSITTPWILSRSIDADQGTEILPATDFEIAEGTVNGDSTWKLSTDGPILIGITGLTFINMVPAGGAAPAGASYVTIAIEGGLTSERRVGGTANRVIVTDNGANTTVTLTAPQDLHTGATVQFAQVTTGDLVMRSPDGQAQWRLIERPDYLELVNELTGERRKITTEPI